MVDPLRSPVARPGWARALDPCASGVARRRPSGGDASTVRDTLGSGPLGVDEVATRSGPDPGRTLAALSPLELEGWPGRSAGARCCRRT